MMIQRHSYQQQGSALIVSLLILLVMTMLGVASMSTASMEEKMAANDRNQKIALRNSELALAAAEFEVKEKSWATIQTDIDGNTAGYYSIIDAHPNYFDNASWVKNTTCIEQSITGINSCYTLEHIHDQQALDINASAGQSQSNMGYKIVRITAYATDNSGLSSARTQSYIQKADLLY